MLFSTTPLPTLRRHLPFLLSWHDVFESHLGYFQVSTRCPYTFSYCLSALCLRFAVFSDAAPLLIPLHSHSLAISIAHEYFEEKGQEDIPDVLDIFSEVTERDSVE
jgi:hypothetical protein